MTPDVVARRSARMSQEADQRDAKRLQALGERIEQAKGRQRYLAETRTAMEAAMKALRP